MIAFDLNKIRKPYFGYEEIARVRGISLDSAKVTASRYASQGLLLRLKKNLYVLREVWNAANKEDKFRLANLGQSPSYVSLMTALDYYENKWQMPEMPGRLFQHPLNWRLFPFPGLLGLVQSYPPMNRKNLLN